MIRKYRKTFAICLKASALLVGLSSGYGRAVAAGCSGSLGSFTCDGAVDTTQNLTGSPLTVTTSSGFSISTSGGDAFDLTSADGLIFTDHYLSTISGFEDGIVAVNSGSADLSIETTGTVTGGTGIGIWANNESGGNNLIIAAAAVTGRDDGINAINSGSGQLVITASGPVLGKTDTGILAENRGTALTITAGEVTGGMHGIVATNLGSSDLSISTTGKVTGGPSGTGIWANNSTGRDLTISAAEVWGGDKGILARNYGSGHLWITANGPVMGDSSHGIDAANFGGGDLSIITTDTVTGGADDMGIWATNHGTDLTIVTAEVSGGDKGILATNHGSGHLSITSNGQITSTGNGMLAFGISATNHGNGTLSITAEDTVSSQGTGAYAIGIYARNSFTSTDLAISTRDVTGGYAGIYANNYGSGTLSITSIGTVEASRGAGIVANNSTSGTDLSISAADISGGTDGIQAANLGSGALDITSNGNVTGTSGSGISAYNFGTDLTISAADVSGGFVGIQALNLGSGALGITSNGAVTGGILGILALSAGTDLAISATDVSGGFGIHALNLGSGALEIFSSGTVTGTAGSGIFAQNIFGTDLIISATNVAGGTDGIEAINLGSGALGISVSGTVIGIAGPGIFAQNNSGTDLTISATNVAGGTDGIEAINLGKGGLGVTAGGTVVGTTGSGIFALNGGSLPATITVASSGAVAGGQAGITAISSSGQPLLIDVYGRVDNLSGLPTDDAIVTLGGPAAVNLHGGSIITGHVTTDDFEDIVTLTGTLDGSLAMNDGNDTLIQWGGSVLTGTADGGGGIDTLSFYSMGPVESTHYLNFENLAFLGGSTTLLGTWDYSSGTSTIYQGSLYVNGELLTSALTVERGGLLGGNGHIFGDVTVFGTVSPGNSIGTLEVTGAVGFMPGSTFVAQLAADGDSDLLRVDGPVTIDGGRLLASLERGLYADGESWRVIEAAGGLRGRFASVDTNFNSATVELTPAYRGSSLDFVIVRTPYETFGGTANEAAVGAGLDTLLPSAEGTMAALLTSMDFDLDGAGISATLAGFNPEMYTAFPAAGLTVSSNFSEIVTLRQQESRTSAVDVSPENPENLWNVWGRAFGDWLDRDTDNGVTGYTLDTGGALFGLDRAFFSAVRAGLVLGYSSSDLSWDTSGNDGEIDGKHIGVYAGAQRGGFYLDGSAGYTSLDNGAERFINTPIFTARTAASFDADVWNGTLTGGYDFAFGPLRLGPVASVDYRYLDQDGIDESGTGVFALRIGSDTEEALASAVGFRASAILHQADWRFLPRAGIALAHQFKDDPVQLTANFAGYPEAAFTVSGAHPADNQVQANLGMTVEYSRSLSLYLDLAAAMASGQDDTLLTGGLAWNF